MPPRVTVFDSAQAVADYLKSRPLRIVTAQAPWGDVPPPAPEREAWRLAHSHRHPHRELLLPLAGECVYAVGGYYYPCRPGIAFCLDGHLEHENFYPAETDGIRHLWLGLLPGQIVGRVIACCDGAASQVSAHVLRYEDVGLLVGTLWPGPSDACTPDRTRARLRVVAEGMLLRWFELAEEEAAAPVGDAKARIVRAIQQHIDECAGRDLGCDELARIAGYSSFHFQRIFKDHAGCTVQQYIDEARIRRCQTLLADGRRSKQIAAELGFSCSSALSRWKRKHGL